MAVLSGVLFLSGSGALVFQTLWLRLSGLTFGNSVWSTALILSSFMTGLALGNAIAASSRRRRRPLHLYAGLELIVALTGSTLVFSLPQLGAGLRPVFQGLWGDPVALAGLRLALAFVILLVPTTAMGLTFPTLLDDDILQGHDFGRTIGWLYGWNTLGAVAGALVGDAFLIKTFGLRGTGVAAAAMDGVAAGGAWLLARSGGTGAPARRIETSF